MAFNIQAKIGADATGYFATMAKVKRAAGEVATGALAGFGIPLGAAAGAGALALLGHNTIEYGGMLTDLSARLGVSTDALQEFDHAMTLNGATIDDATDAMQKLAIARKEALEDGGEKMEAFKALGISVEQLKTARLEDLFKAVGRSVRDASDIQTVLGDAFELMGKRAGKVLTAMRADLEAAGAEAHSLGLIIDEDTLNKLDAIGDSATTTGKRMTAAFAPFITFVMEGVNSIIDGFDVLFSITARWGEMFGKISAGMPIGQATAEKDAGIEQDLAKIQERKEARRSDRPIAPRGEAALGFAGDGEGEGAVRRAAKALELREKIAKMDRDALPLAEKRAALEADILKKRMELAEVEATEDTSPGGAAEEKSLRLQLDLRELEKQLAGAEDKPEKDIRGGRGPERNVDALAKVGLFVGGMPSGPKTEPLTGPEAARLNALLLNELRAVERAARDGRAWA